VVSCHTGDLRQHPMERAPPGTGHADEPSNIMSSSPFFFGCSNMDLCSNENRERKKITISSFVFFVGRSRNMCSNEIRGERKTCSPTSFFGCSNMCSNENREGKKSPYLPLLFFGPRGGAVSYERGTPVALCMYLNTQISWVPRGCPLLATWRVRDLGIDLYFQIDLAQMPAGHQTRREECCQPRPLPELPTGVPRP